MAVNVRHKTIGGVSVPYGALVNTAGEEINPATEDKQDDIIAPLGTATDAPATGSSPEGATSRTGIALQKRIVNNLLDIKFLIGNVGAIVWDCEDKDAFAAVNDATNIADATEHVTGDQAVNWDKAGTHVNSGISDTFTGIDLASFGPADYLMLALNLSSLTDVNTIKMRLGTDSSNYTEWQWDVATLVTGWQILAQTLAKYTSITGTGMQQSSVTWGSLTVVFGTSGTTLADITLDHVGFVSAASIAAEDNAVHTEDEPHVSGDKGNMIFGVRTDSRGSLVDTDGDYASVQLTGPGDLRTRDDDLLTEVGAKADSAAAAGSIHAKLRIIYDSLAAMAADTGNLDYVVSAIFTATITTTAIIPTAFSTTLPAGLVRIVLIPRGDMYWAVGGAATASTSLIGQGSWLNMPVTKTLADTIQVFAAGAGVPCDLLICTPR